MSVSAASIRISLGVDILDGGGSSSSSGGSTRVHTAVRARPSFGRVVADALDDSIFDHVTPHLIIGDAFASFSGNGDASCSPGSPGPSLGRQQLLQECAQLLADPRPDVVAGAASVLAEQLPSTAPADAPTALQWVSLVFALVEATTPSAVQASMSRQSGDAMRRIQALAAAAHMLAAKAEQAPAQPASPPPQQQSRPPPQPPQHTPTQQQAAGPKAAARGAAAQSMPKALRAAERARQAARDIAQDEVYADLEHAAIIRTRLYQLDKLKQQADLVLTAAEADMRQAGSSPEAAAAAAAAVATERQRLAAAVLREMFTLVDPNTPSQAESAALAYVSRRLFIHDIKHNSSLQDLGILTTAALLATAIPAMAVCCEALRKSAAMPEQAAGEQPPAADAGAQATEPQQPPHVRAKPTDSAQPAVVAKPHQPAAPAQAGPPPLAAAAAADVLAAMVIAMQCLDASRGGFGDLRVGNTHDFASVAMALQRLLLDAEPLVAASAAAAPRREVVALASVAANSIRSILPLTLRSGSSYDRFQAIIPNVLRLLVPLMCLQTAMRNLLRRTALGSAAFAAALKPLCSVLRAATAWQQTELASLLTRRPLLLLDMAPSSTASMLNRSVHYQDIVALVVNVAASAASEASQQLLGAALASKQPAALEQVVAQLAGWGVPAALSALLALPAFATAAPAAATLMMANQQAAIDEAGAAGRPRRPPLLSAAHANAAFAGMVESLLAGGSSLPDGVTEAAVGAAASLLTFSRLFCSGELVNEAGCRFAVTGASMLVGLVARSPTCSASTAAQQAAHKATLELLGWLPGTNAMSRELLDNVLAVLGATVACAATPEVADQLVAVLTAVKQQVSHRVATELSSSFKDALGAAPKQQRVAFERARSRSIAATAAAKHEEKVDKDIMKSIERKHLRAQLLDAQQQKRALDQTSREVDKLCLDITSAGHSEGRYRRRSTSNSIQHHVAPVQLSAGPRRTSELIW